MTAIPPGIPGTAMFKTMQADLAKIDELVGEAVSELSGWKGSVEAASLAATNLTLSGEQTIDGVVVTAGELVLVWAQTTATQNGIYVCSVDAWSRSDKMPVGYDAAGAAVYVTKGTTNGDKVFICTNDIAGGIVGTNNLVFAPLVTSPAGSDTQLQYNNGGVMGGSTVTYNDGTGALTVATGGLTVTAGGITATAGGITASAGDITATLGNLAISAATSGVTLNKGTVTIADFAAGAAAVTARQGVITVTSAVLAADAVGTIVVTATAMVAATSLILVSINARSATTGAPIVQVTARTAPDTFTIVVKNGDAVEGMTGSMNIGYVIM